MFGMSIQAIEQVKEEVKDPMWLSNLIKTYLLDNQHRVQLTSFPMLKKMHWKRQQKKHV